MARQSWSSWTVGPPVQRAAKLRGAGGVDAFSLYVDITCPYCGDVFEASSSSVQKNKSNVCKAHLAAKKCNLTDDRRGGADAAVLALPPSKRMRSGAVLHQNCVPMSRFSALEIRTEALERQCEVQAARTASLEHDRELLADNLIAAFPSFHKPVLSDNVVQQVGTLLRVSLRPESPPACDAEVRLRMLQKKHESVLLELNSIRAENERLRNGKELIQQKRITKCFQEKANAKDRLLSFIDKQLCQLDGVVDIDRVMSALAAIRGAAEEHNQTTRAATVSARSSPVPF